jgi:hypothetical protein
MESYPYQFNEQMFRSQVLYSTLNRHLCENDKFDEEEQPLRVHVGNIPFLWTIDDLRKQFLV